MAIKTETPTADQASRVAPALLVAVSTSTVISLVYVLIGLRVIQVIDPADDQPAFGFAAAGFFLVLAGALWVVRRRLVWIVAGFVQVLVAFVYFDLAPEREPSYEARGIGIRILQIPLLLALGCLVLRQTKGPFVSESDSDA